MTPERLRQLELDATAQLTEEELREGWRFCIHEWDGMLIHQDSPEASVCLICRKDYDDSYHSNS